MQYFLSWRIFFKVNKKEKAERKLKKLFSLMNMEYSVRIIEQYWKIAEYYACEGDTVFESGTFQEAVFRVFQALDQVSGTCRLWYPECYENKCHCEFLISRPSDHISLDALQFFSLHLSNENNSEVLR